jgi:dipeptidyl aminopeptidase/acylaminoacyl peptidase
VPDGGGQGEDALQDADYHAAGGVAAVLFQVELAFEGVVNGFDDLAQWLEELGACPGGLALAGGPQEFYPGAGHGGLEGGAEVVLVADEGLAWPGGDQVGAGGEHAGQHLALIGLRAGQGEGDGQAVQGAHQVQPEAPEVARVAGAVPVFSPSGQVRTFGGLPGAAAFDRVLCVAFSPDGKILATADSDGTARLWDVVTRRQIGVIRVGRDRVLGVAFSPDGNLLATAGEGGSARLWDVATGHQVGAAMTPGPDSSSQPRPFSWVTAVTFSPNGRVLATDTEVKAQLWDVATQRQTGKPIGAVGANEGVFRLAFSPDSRVLATVGNPRIKLWNVVTHQRIGTAMSAGATAAYGVAFSPSGTILVTTDTSGVIRLWDVATHQRVGKQIAPNGRHEFLLEELSPNGRVLATTQFDGPAQLWRLNLRQHDLSVVK